MTTLVQTARKAKQHWFLVVLGIIAIVSMVRIVSDTDDISSAGTIRAAIIATCPILMAALGGLWAERAGVVNIGLEGQMIMGTWGAAFFAYHEIGRASCRERV